MGNPRLECWDTFLACAIAVRGRKERRLVLNGKTFGLAMLLVGEVSDVGEVGEVEKQRGKERKRGSQAGCEENGRKERKRGRRRRRGKSKGRKMK